MDARVKETIDIFSYLLDMKAVEGKWLSDIKQNNEDYVCDFNNGSTMKMK